MEPHSEKRCVLFATRDSFANGTVILGLRPVERTVLSFQRAGVREFLITGDADATAQIAEMLASGACRRVRFRVASNLATALHRDESVLLARTDRHYDRRLVARFVDESGRKVGARVALDFRKDALAAHGSAARAAVWNREPGGSLRMCAQELVGADAVMVGLAVAGPGFARALAEVGNDPRAWEKALNALAEREPVESWPVAGLWQEIADDDDVVLARRKILAGAVGVADGVVARRLNRPISRRITEHLVSRDVKVWQVSVSSFLAQLAAGLSFGVGHAATGGILAQTAAVLDGVDGELARIRYQDSPFGSVYDALLDRIGDAALIGGMTFYAWLLGDGLSAVALGFAAVAGSSLSMVVKEKYATQYQRRYATEREGRFNWLLLGRDGRLFLAFLAGMTGYVEAVLAYVAVGTHFHAGMRIYRIRSEAASV